MPMAERQPGWSWFDQPELTTEPESELGAVFLACFAGRAGEQVLDHLERMFLSRRVSPSASDAELRHVEGQRSVIAYIHALIERGREPREDRS
jgi:hypothetical protein